jgi:2-hydroxy-3-oxopropionate reductase
MNIALLGTGLMGYPMAERLCGLCKAGHAVSVWNRTRAKADSLAALGAQVHDSPAAAARDAEFVITMLTDGDAVEDLLFSQGVARAMHPGSVLLDMSSIQPAQARTHAERLGGMGIVHMDAPVSGGTLGAAAGTLAIMVGGKPTTFERARPVLAPLGRATLVGGSGAGQLAKLANQMIVGITIGAVAEALLLCEKGGANPAKVREAITGGFADSRILQVHGQRMVDHSYPPGARMNVQLKDLRNALATAQGLGLETPITTLLEQLYAGGVGTGLSDLDHSALHLALAQRNGMA